MGRGTYGIVYRARHTRSDQAVALKRCLHRHQESDGFPETSKKLQADVFELLLIVF